MNCKYLLKRSKNYKPVFYCKLNKRYIDYKVDCGNCLFKEYKENKGINKVSKKRVCVSKETYQKYMKEIMADVDFVEIVIFNYIIYITEVKEKI